MKMPSELLNMLLIDDELWVPLWKSLRALKKYESH
jgi:hypothetical protein